MHDRVSIVKAKSVHNEFSTAENSGVGNKRIVADESSRTKLTQKSKGKDCLRASLIEARRTTKTVSSKTSTDFFSTISLFYMTLAHLTGGKKKGGGANLPRGILKVYAKSFSRFVSLSKP